MRDDRKAFDLICEMISYLPNNAKLYRKRASFRDYTDAQGYLNDLKRPEN